MRRLKYKGTPTDLKDEVWIDAWRTTGYESSTIGPGDMYKVFGMIDKKMEPECIHRIKFWIYKNRPSWIEINEKRIEFTYDIMERSDTTDIDDKAHWWLKVQWEGMPLLTKSTIPVAYNCAPKKTLIKDILEELVKYKIETNEQQRKENSSGSKH